MKIHLIMGRVESSSYAEESTFATINTAKEHTD
jgi:hypothetical protein